MSKLTLVPGNHDITLDADFYAQHGLQFHNQHHQKSEDCLDLLKGSTSITYLDHASATIRLAKEDGPRTTFKVFGSPYSPARGLWAFGYGSDQQALQLWDQIPLDTDVLVTHTPPKYHCDESKDCGSTGCEVLRQTLWRVRPRLAICGHVHEGRGVERVRWDLGASNIKFKEADTMYWTDPGRDNKKQSLLDFTAKGGAGLDNDGADGREQKTPMPDFGQELHKVPPVPVVYNPSASASASTGAQPTESYSSSQLGVADFFAGGASDSNYVTSATGGGSGIPPSGRCDVEVLSGRPGRRETCVINASIRASSWSHKGSVGNRLNKPIVVDIDLPVWRDCADGTPDA